MLKKPLGGWGVGRIKTHSKLKKNPLQKNKNRGVFSKCDIHTYLDPKASILFKWEALEAPQQGLEQGRGTTYFHYYLINLVLKPM